MGVRRVSRDDARGWQPWHVVSWVVAGAVSIPAVVGFVTMGAAVLVVRSVRDVVRQARDLLGNGGAPGRDGTDGDGGPGAA